MIVLYVASTPNGHKASVSPLRQSMLDDMALRRLSPRAQKTYIRVVKDFTLLDDNDLGDTA